MQVSCVAQGKRAGRKKTMHQPFETFLTVRIWVALRAMALLATLCSKATEPQLLSYTLRQPILSVLQKPTDAPMFLLRGAHSIEWKSGRRWITNSAVVRPLPICPSVWMTGEYFSPRVQRFQCFQPFCGKASASPIQEIPGRCSDHLFPTVFKANKS